MGLRRRGMCCWWVVLLRVDLELAHFNIVSGRLLRRIGVQAVCTYNIEVVPEDAVVFVFVFKLELPKRLSGAGLFVDAPNILLECVRYRYRCRR